MKKDGKEWSDGLSVSAIEGTMFWRDCVPHPCTNTDLEEFEQLQKIRQEVDELRDALAHEDRDAILEEGTDVIVAVTTLLAKKYSLAERMAAVREVNRKNKIRHYYLENQNTLQCIYCSQQNDCYAPCERIQVPYGVYFRSSGNWLRPEVKK